MKAESAEGRGTVKVRSSGGTPSWRHTDDSSEPKLYMKVNALTNRITGSFEELVPCHSFRDGGMRC